MENQQVSEVQKPEISSFSERMADVFSSPGELYTEVAAVPVQKSSWVVPYILTLIMTVAVSFAIFTSQTLKNQALEPQREAMQKRVETGEMTQEQADRAAEFMEGSTMMLITGSVVSVFFVTLMMFGAPLVLWIVVRFVLKSSIGYKKMLEAYALASLIGILNGIITLIMMHLFDSVRAAPGASLILLDGYDPGNFLHMFVASLNLITIWQTAVLGIGIARLSNRSAGTGIAVSFGLWLLWVIVSSVAGVGMR